MTDKKNDRVDAVQAVVQELVDKMNGAHLDYHKYEPEIEKLKAAVEDLK